MQIPSTERLKEFPAYVFISNLAADEREYNALHKNVNVFNASYHIWHTHLSLYHVPFCALCLLHTHNYYKVSERQFHDSFWPEIFGSRYVVFF